MSPYSQNKQEEQSQVFHSALSESQPKQDKEGIWEVSLTGHEVKQKNDTYSLGKSQINVDVIGQSEVDEL